LTDKSNKVKPIPDGYHAVTPWIVVRGAAQLLDFMKEAFGAEEIARVNNPDGKIGHAETRIGDSVVMLFDAREDWLPTPCFLRLYVEDADAVYKQALKAGAVSVTEVTSLSFGDKVGRVRDPFGNVWWIQTHIEDVSLEEMAKRDQEPTYRDAMQQVEESLDRELKSRVYQ
jgi:PhnB protein